MTLPATSELVAINYIRSLNYGATGTPGVGTTVPKDATTWASGFVQVGIVGGVTDIDVPTRKPIVQLDVYVPSINTTKPQWGRANALAETVVAACYGDESPATVLNLGTGRAGARVQSVYLASEPRRMWNDPGGYARYTFDLVIVWVNAG